MSIPAGHPTFSSQCTADEMTVVPVNSMHNGDRPGKHVVFIPGYVLTRFCNV